MAEKISVDAECESCRGTGVYRGACEASGEAVVCSRCNGRGGVVLKYTPFTTRNIREDVRVVKSLNSGAFSRHGKNPVTYEQFLSGKMPI